MENSEFEKPSFPKILLERPIQERIDYFNRYIIAHPHLRQAYNEMINAIYHAPGISLVFLVGPTGVGKTRLLHRSVEKVNETALPELEVDQGKIPIFGVEAKSPEDSSFDWKDFYIRILKAIYEPLIDQKISYATDQVNGQSNKSKCRLAVESALRNRHPDAFYIDEAHHLASLSSGKKLINQPEVLKSLANLTNVKIILAGTYQLLPLIDLGDQLCRRTKTIHLPRYRLDSTSQQEANSQNITEQEIFQNIVQEFQEVLPLDKTPDLIGNWEFLYERSLGCVGMLKDWLSTTLYDVLNQNKKVSTMTLTDLKRNARPTKQCLKIFKQIKEGEKNFEESLEDLETLRLGLGLNSDNEKGKGSESIQVKQESSPNQGKNRVVGQPSPTRYSTGLPKDEK
jgi:hypothetical protein